MRRRPTPFVLVEAILWVSLLLALAAVTFALCSLGVLLLTAAVPQVGSP